MSWMPYAALGASQVAQGYAQKREYGYSKGVQQAKAKTIEFKKGLEAQRYDRAIQQYISTVTARTAASGLEMKGSPAEVLVDSLTQIEMDKQIGQYNLEIEKRFAKSKGRYYGSMADTALLSGFGSAGLTAGSYYAKKGQLAKSGTKTGRYGRIRSNYGKEGYRRYTR